MGKTIEQIRIGKTSKSLRATSSFFRYGPDPLITIPARGFWNAAQRGLTEDRTRSHANRVRNFLHHGRQPQKAAFLRRKGAPGSHDQGWPSRYSTPPDHWGNVAAGLAWTAQHCGG